MNLGSQVHLKAGPSPLSTIQVVSLLVMNLDLPASLFTICPVFYFSLFQPAPTDYVLGRCQPLPDPVGLYGDQEWEVCQILGSKLNRGTLKCLAKWEVIDDDEHLRSNWQPIINLEQSQEG